MTITKIKRIGNTSRFHVYADEQFAGIFLDEILVTYKFAVGKDFDNKEFQKIKAENDVRVCFDMAASYVEKYNTSQKGIKDYLKKKGFDEKTIKNALAKLKEYGLVDDEKFAKNYAESISSHAGKRVVAQKLRAKGVSSEIIDDIIENIDEDAEIEKAVMLANKFVKNRQKDAKIKQKCLAHLIYKGYDYSVAQKASQMALSNFALKGEEDDWN